MNTTRIKAGAGTTSITYGHATFVPDADGAFTVPADIAAALVNQGSAAYAPDVAPAVASAPSNVFSIGFEAVTVDLADIAMRVKLTELESFCRMHPSAAARFVDSEGATFAMTASEASHLIMQVRNRQFGNAI
jgi:hypothetical protein